jgi:putative transcriptional regulator
MSKAAAKKTTARKPKLSAAGAKVVAALEETLAAMRAGKPLTARRYHVTFPLPEYGPLDVRRVRGLFGMSQAIFAQFLGVDTNTIQSWEQGARRVSSVARRFLGELESDPDYWRQKIDKCKRITAVPANGKKPVAGSDQDRRLPGPPVRPPAPAKGVASRR